MTKKQLENIISDRVELPISKTKEVLDELVNIINEEVGQGNDFKLNEVGTFKPTIRTSRMGRNPKTGEAIRIPEKKIVKFKPSKRLQISASTWLGSNG